MSKLPSKIAQIVFVLSLTALTSLTWWLGVVNWKYLDHGSIAFSGGFPGSEENWENHGDSSNISISGDGVRLTRNADEHSYAKYRVKIPDTPDHQVRHLRVTATIEVEAEDTDKEGAGAALMIWYLNPSNDDDVIEYKTFIPLIGAKKNSVIWNKRVLAVPKGSQFFHLALINRESSGSYLLTDAVLELVSKSKLYLVCVGFLFVLWFLAIIFIFLILWEKSGKWHTSVLLVTILGITLGATWPERMDSFFALSKDSSWVMKYFSDWAYKIGHFVLFFAISVHMFFYRDRFGLTLWICFLILVLFAFATEGMQLHFIARTTQWTDFLIDVAGIVVAAALVWLIENFKRRTTRPQN